MSNLLAISIIVYAVAMTVVIGCTVYDSGIWRRRKKPTVKQVPEFIKRLKEQK